MSVITKQLIINELRLPKELIDIIKQYCFYNIEEVAKKNKLKTVRLIESVEYSRANRFGGDPYYSDSEEHWTFGFAYNESNKDTLQLQATNCSMCGNYTFYCHDFTIHSIVCYCWDQEDDGWNTDDLYSDDNE